MEAEAEAEANGVEAEAEAIGFTTLPHPCFLINLDLSEPGMTTKFVGAKQENVSTPLPLEHKQAINSKQCGYRIWIGNVDLQLNEFSLLQQLKRFGKIVEFDFLFHKSGPLQGKSRGFHFATFEAKKDAENAIQHLNGKQLFSKPLIVRWADEPVFNDKDTAVNINLKTDLVKKDVETSSQLHHKISKKQMICSIEEKLKEMDRSGEGSTTSSGLHPLLQKSKANEAAEEARKKRMQPYQKNYRKKR